MRTWQARDAGARFSELLDASLTEGPQAIAKHGNTVAVLVPVATWRRLRAAAGPTLKDLLLANTPRWETPFPPRGRLRRRLRPAPKASGSVASKA